jgi:hypothetical protein
MLRDTVAADPGGRPGKARQQRVQVAAEPTVELNIEGEPNRPSRRVAALTPRQIFWREFRKDRLALVSIDFIV